jgi:signal transduction histidine kinase/CheY-like chemotaxis protein
MTLRRRATFVVGSSFLALTVLLFAAVAIVVVGRFRTVETEEAQTNAARARHALDESVSSLVSSARDWAHWDDAAAFVTGRRPGFVETNLVDETFLTLTLNFILFTGSDGRVKYERWFDRNTRTTGPLPAGLAEATGPGAPLLTLAGVGSHQEGLLVLPDSILLVASQPVTNSDETPPTYGTLVFARLLDKAQEDRLSGIVQLETSISSLDNAALSPAERRSLLAAKTGATGLVIMRDANHITSMLPLRDVRGTVSAVLSVGAPRPIYREGLLSLHYLAVSLVAWCLITAGLLLVLLSRVVLTPLSLLARNVRSLGVTGSQARLAVHGHDELAELAKSVNEMLDALGRGEQQRTRLEERLLQAHKLEAIGTLAGGVAHDFNNILMAILGFCDLLDASTRGEAAARAQVEEVRKAAMRAASLTNQLLSFSRQQRLQFRVLDFNTLLSDMAGMLQRLLGEHVELRFELEPDLAAIKADIGQIQQVILNLAVNARDAMPRGGTLTITTRNVTIGESPTIDLLELRPGLHMLCAVRDTGEGMEEAVKARIFEPFFTTKEIGKGTGLGLSVIWGIVKQSGGAVNVTTAPGHGTTFEIYLPAADEPLPEAASAQSSSASVGNREIVLVVEDDEAIRLFLAATLTNAGYTVLQAADGEQALSLVQEYGGSGIQLLLSDIVMPRMGGGLLAQRLRKRFPSMKVLFISGNADLMGSQAGVPEDAVILQKPFTQLQLLQLLHAALHEGIVKA